VLLEHPSLAPFEPFLWECSQIAHTTGLEALSSAGLTLADIGSSQAASLEHTIPFGNTGAWWSFVLQLCASHVFSTPLALRSDV
jgi:hypothetical protein